MHCNVHNAHRRMYPLVLIAWAWLSLSSGAASQGLTILPSQVYTPQPGVQMVPNTDIGSPAAKTLLEVAGPNQCAAACREQAGCTWFKHCDSPEGCPGDPGEGMKFQECQLLDVSCTLQPPVRASGSSVQVTSGFLVVKSPEEISGFTEVLARGIVGGDYDCPGSLLPGTCAFSSALVAASTCIRNPDCQAVQVYTNGTDGCSSPVAILKHAVLAPTNTFVSAQVSTLQKSETEPEVSIWLYASEGRVLAPTREELAAAALAANSSNSSSSSSADSGWDGYLGCVLGEAALMDGLVLAVLNDVQSAEACCRVCRRWAMNSTSDSSGDGSSSGSSAGYTGGNHCDAWNYCDSKAGCSFTNGAVVPTVVNLAHRQCELRFQELATPSIGSPPVLLAKGPVAAGFVAGSPLALWGPELPGFKRLPGRSLYAYGRYNCTGSIRPQAEECVLESSPEQLAEYCLNDYQCVAFQLKPGGSILSPHPSSSMLGIFKKDDDASAILLTPTTIMYVRQSPAGLSTGAIAGIAVGSVVAVVLLVAGALLMLHRWQQRREQRNVLPEAGGKVPESLNASSGEGAGSDSCKPGGAGRHSQPASTSPPGTLPTAFGTAAGLPYPAPSEGTNASGSLDYGKLLTSARSTSSQLAAGVISPQPLIGHLSRANSSPMHLTGRHSYPPFRAAAANAHADSAPGSGVSGTTSPTASLNTHSPHDSLGRTGTGQSAALPELVQHVAQIDALPPPSHSSSGNSVSPRGPLIQLSMLSPRLREWVVDRSAITYLHKQDGSLWELGSGASSRVFKAVYNGEQVAAKELDIGASRELQEAFLTEAERLQSLRHPNIIQFYGISWSGGKGIILLEFCEGRDMYSALSVVAAGTSQRLFSWQRRGRRAAYELAKALNYMHSKGVVHFDIKSGNVLLTANGAVRLGDVGLSRLQTHTFMSDVALVGTFAWIAPEVLLGNKQCTQAVDIFSFGVVLWEIVTGERPRRGGLRDPRVPQECPQEVADLIVECLSEDPTQRPTAKQVLQRLGQLLERRGGGSGVLPGI